MMSLWDALRMNMMISYQELVRTFLSKQHALQTPCGFLQLSILNKRRGDKADNASFSMEALFHNPSGLASCMNSIRRRSPVGNCRRLE
ncbi:hypothetical protein BL142_00025305 [Klebsiella pneumoniae]|nr:hypothetical protein BL142_00025305 [Klebsiella pneumoniae]RNY68985.1 hypothetical protein C5X93_019500 [Klebsiella pneumoniae subsp. pneumoniae]